MPDVLIAVSPRQLFVGKPDNAARAPCEKQPLDHVGHRLRWCEAVPGKRREQRMPLKRGAGRHSASHYASIEVLPRVHDQAIWSR